MPRVHWLILVGGALIAFAAVVYTSGQRLDGNGAEDADGDLGERPDLLMNQGVIRQFAPSGALEYQLRATRIEHFGASALTRLVDPELTLFQPRAQPWRMTAERGMIESMDSSTARKRETDMPVQWPKQSDSAEQVRLRGAVHVRREGPENDFFEVRTQALTIYPAAQYARTDQSVKLASNFGTTTAAGLRGNLRQGRVELLSTADELIHTQIEPGLIERP